jgi:hypothetical protein
MTSTPRQYGCTVPRQKNGRIAGYRWCICETDSRRQVSLQETYLDYDELALEQSTKDFVIVTAGHDIQQSVHFSA